jgi:hypothetical protein
MKKKLVFGTMLICLLALGLTLIGCPTESGGEVNNETGGMEEGGGSEAEIPDAYQNTTWTSTTGSKIELTTSSVKVTPSGGYEREIQLIVSRLSSSDTTITVLIFGISNAMSYIEELEIRVKTDGSTISIEVNNEEGSSDTYTKDGTGGANHSRLYGVYVPDDKYSSFGNVTVTETTITIKGTAHTITLENNIPFTANGNSYSIVFIKSGAKRVGAIIDVETPELFLGMTADAAVAWAFMGSVPAYVVEDDLGLFSGSKQ